jgi:hypothetical protein
VAFGAGGGALGVCQPPPAVAEVGRMGTRAEGATSHGGSVA